MSSTRDICAVFAILLGLAPFTNTIKYVGVPEDDEIYSECPNQPKNVLSFYGLFDCSQATFTVELDKIVFAGNATTIWNVQPNDRIELYVQVFKFNRGVWEPTVIAIKIPDFCAIMFDKNQFWYNLMIVHILNLDEVKDKCLKVPGTVYNMEPYDLRIAYDSMTNMDGRAKMVFTLKAFDRWYKQRPTSICFEVKGESIRV